ncbi:MAG TPA: hypothetical protein VMJ32_03135 [Pirellulales bacterium]|nr:hypothetical protein [Pirellulales bacterium]
MPVAPTVPISGVCDRAGPQRPLHRLVSLVKFFAKGKHFRYAASNRHAKKAPGVFAGG